jgi:hypothetical protein
MFFERKDPISIYTVTCACAEVVSDLLVAKHGVGFIRSGDVAYPEKRKLARDILRHPENFLKHADRDPNDTLRFNVELVPLTLFEAIYEYRMLVGRFEWEMVVFVIWFAIKYPKVILEGQFKEITKKVASSLDPEDYDLLRQALDHCPPEFKSK